MSVPVRSMTLALVARSRTHPHLWDAGWVAAFSILMSILAQISIPLPFTPVPISGQTFGVLLAGALLGSRRGAAAMLVYLAEGAAGLPVFALGHSGPGVILGPTGGYLLSYPVAAFVVGLLAERGWDRSFWRAAVAMLCGEATIYVIALPWLGHFVPASSVVALGFLPFIPGDITKLALAAALLPSGWALAGMLRSRWI